jgi:hypothetical protein
MWDPASVGVARVDRAVTLSKDTPAEGAEDAEADMCDPASVDDVARVDSRSPKKPDPAGMLCSVTQSRSHAVQRPTAEDAEAGMWDPASLGDVARVDSRSQKKPDPPGMLCVLRALVC